MSVGPNAPDDPPGLYGYKMRFGGGGEDVAQLAGHLLADLEGDVPPHDVEDDGMVLDEHDRDNLGTWVEIVTGLPLIEVPFETAGAERTELHDTITRFHMAMPFTEAERHWLLTVAMQGDDASRQPSEIIARKTDEILTAGVRQPVNGRELMRRWAAWRRESDEFAGQGSLELARTALSSLRRLLA